MSGVSPRRVKTSSVGFPAGGGGYSRRMILLGVLLIIIGIVASIPVLYTIGVILAIVGVVLWILGATGRAVGGRTHWF